MIQLFSKDESLFRRLNEIGIAYQGVTDIDADEEKVFVSDVDSFASLLMHYPSAKVFVLSPMPNFTEGVTLLQQGVRGYGNSYMQKTHFCQAVATIENDAIWIYPELMQELILQGSKAVISNEDVLESLSVRERDVAKELEKGLSNKEIALALAITERTVKAHLSSIYEKLGVSDRLALAVLLRK
ncbi:response regulator transcription factor [Sulfurimonas sp. HSL3-7]|uniref:response regulator transcription factor n=1 Tax=Sulfonitrofixus jiaomeiensis TaxID=3131938 RepID=UPI0031F9C6A4